MTNIAAPNLDTSHTFSVTEGTNTYTVMITALSYAYTSVKNSDSARQNPWQGSVSLYSGCRCLLPYGLNYKSDFKEADGRKLTFLDADRYEEKAEEIRKAHPEY